MYLTNKTKIEITIPKFCIAQCPAPILPVPPYQLNILTLITSTSFWNYHGVSNGSPSPFPSLCSSQQVQYPHPAPWEVEQSEKGRRITFLDKQKAEDSWNYT